MLAHVVEAKIEPVADVLPDRPGNGDPARLGDALEPRRHVDAIPVDVFGLDDHIADVDADAKLYSPVLRHTLIALTHASLDHGGAGHRIDDAWELREEPVARVLHDAALVLGDLGVDQLRAVGFPGGMGAGLVQAHEPAVGHGVCGEDGGQAPVHRQTSTSYPSPRDTRVETHSKHTRMPGECLYLPRPDRDLGGQGP